MSFAQRIDASARYERDVRLALDELGWRAEPFGQALLSEPMREHLRSGDTKARWLPDIIAAVPGMVIYVDAKASKAHSTGNHAVERASTEALVAWQQFTGAPVYYAFPHDVGSSFVALDDWVSAKHPGPASGGSKGSGTPFDLAPCRVVCPSVWLGRDEP